MPMANVKKFALRAMQEPELRKRLNRAKDQAERDAILEEIGLPFTDGEFEEGYRSILVTCQTQADADHLNEFKLWWEMLRRS